MPLILGAERRNDAEYLETCRKKRNIVEYDYVGGATEADVNELISFVQNLQHDVLGWLKKYHPEFVSF
jgi:hypothetical protein